MLSPHPRTSLEIRQSLEDMATDFKLNKLTLAVLVALGVVVLLFLLSNIRSGQSYTTESIRLSELISASIDLARKGGNRVKDIRNMDDAEIGKLSKGLTKEGKEEYVTIGDKVSVVLRVLISTCIAKLLQRIASWLSVKDHAQYMTSSVARKHSFWMPPVTGEVCIHSTVRSVEIYDVVAS